MLEVGDAPLSTQLLKRQLQLLAKIPQQPATSLTRQITFKDGDVTMKTWHSRRKQGRPRVRWVTAVFALARAVATGGDHELKNLLLGSENQWKAKVDAFFA